MTGAKGYETRDINLRPVLNVTLGLAVLMFASMGLMGLTLDYFRGQVEPEEPHPLAGARTESTAPQLLVQEDRARLWYEGAVKAQLHGYRWLDRGQGLVAIPVERAMECLLEEGFPVAEDSR